MTQDRPTVTVSARWMAACGYSAVDTPLKVIRIQESASWSRMGTCYIVEHPKIPNHEWTVFQDRLIEEQRNG